MSLNITVHIVLGLTYGLKRAEEAGIPTKTHILKNYYKGTTKDQVEERNSAGNTRLDCVCWMDVDFVPTVLQPLEEAGITIINLHPALPGAFDGTHAIDRCWKAGQDGEITKGGVMIHRVIAEVDRGESLEEYEDRVHKVEHVAIVEGTNITLEQLSK
ncbi:Phosphoribosylglycinamide formyltransferase [Candida viswanathii]|uniref:phosphoribosylglycinamide formyltransferase 1 n=1 Tax=Candida viswanathii TaxID=5486 RepID=A0A367YL50_9ASCO|nr:Phosphoribosylglycinamide formyltransferase [Candida viswanathii]